MQSCNKPLPKPVLTKISDTIWHHYTTMSSAGVSDSQIELIWLLAETGTLVPSNTGGRISDVPWRHSGRQNSMLRFPPRIPVRAVPDVMYHPTNHPGDGGIWLYHHRNQVSDQLIGPWGIWLQSQISKFQTHFNNKYLKYFLWNCYQVNATTPHWSLVHIGSGNGLVPSGNKPLPEPMLT